MAFKFVARQTQHFGVALGEFVDKNCHFAQFGGAHGSKICRMCEQNAPAIDEKKKYVYTHKD